MDNMITKVFTLITVGITAIHAQSRVDPDGGFQALPFECSAGQVSRLCRPTQDIGPREVKLAAKCQNCTRILNLCTRHKCPQEGPVTVFSRKASKSVIFMDDCLSWVTAQAVCCDKYGGRLWEPRTKEEYEEVMEQAISSNNNFRTG
jgi:hypothetical protein